MRVNQWPEVLDAKINEWRRRPFNWAGSNCCQFTADVVLALTGVDHRDAFPTYETKEQAESILADLGGVVALATLALGEPKPVTRAQRGDVVACDFGDGLAVGICLGVKCVAPGPRGLIERPTINAVAAWSV